MTTTSPVHPASYYRPRGAALASFRDTSPEVLLSGPSGTGKSRACLEKLYWAATTYPGFRGLIVRQVRASLSETGLATWENLVLPPRHPARGSGSSREHRAFYQFPNGSQVNVGGLDKPGKIMSSEYDLIYPQEATELKEDGWEALTTRLRNGAMPYQQLLADCNPSAPTHWLKRRCDGGTCRMLHSRHEDNPRLHNGHDWTPFGRSYLKVLDGLTGVRRERLRYGRWRQAEGVVYDGWDSAVHVIDRFPIPADWPRYLAVDFGYTNPLVIQWWAEDPDGRLYLYREFVRTKTLVEDAAKQAKFFIAADSADAARLIRADLERRKPADLTRQLANIVATADRAVRPKAIVCDHDAEDRATLEKHLSMATLAAPKAVTTGIQAVAARLVVAGDGKPRLVVFRDALAGRDAGLDAAKKPCGLIEEIEGYSWDAREGRPPREEPVKADDHSCLVAGTLVETDYGPIPIELIRAGDFVLTRAGYRRVLAAGMTNAAARVGTIQFDNGQTLTGTADHPVWACDSGFVSSDVLRYNDRVLSLSGSSWKSSPCQVPSGSRVSASGASCTVGIRLPSKHRIATTTGPDRATFARGGRTYTAMSGLPIAVRSRTGMRSITPMGTRSTMTPTTCNFSPSLPIATSTATRRADGRGYDGRRCRPNASGPCGMPPPNGTVLPPAANGIVVMLGGCLETSPRYGGTVIGVESRIRWAALRSTSPSSVPTIARSQRDGIAGWTTSSAIVPDAAVRSESTSTPSNGSALARVRGCTTASKTIGLVPCAVRRSMPTPPPPSDFVPCRVLTRVVHPAAQPVFNLTVDGSPEFFANGILVHNCDPARYITLWKDMPRPVPNIR